MKRSFYVVIPFAILALGSGIFAATKPKPTLVGYLNSDAVLSAHPKFSTIKTLKQQADKDLKPTVDKLKTLETKIQSGKATAKEKKDYQALLKTYASLTKKWGDKTQKALEPIYKSVDSAVKSYANKNKYGIIIDQKIAAQSKLVIYGNPDADLTDAVAKLVK